MKDYTKLEKEVDAVSENIWGVASNVWEFAELGYKEFNYLQILSQFIYRSNK